MIEKKTKELINLIEESKIEASYKRIAIRCFKNGQKWANIGGEEVQ